MGKENALDDRIRRIVREEKTKPDVAAEKVEIEKPKPPEEPKAPKPEPCICAECGHKHDAEVKVCEECGAKLTWVD